MIQCFRRCPVTIQTLPSGRSTHKSPMAHPPRRKRSNDKSTLGYASIAELLDGRVSNAPTPKPDEEKEPDESALPPHFPRLPKTCCRRDTTSPLMLTSRVAQIEMQAENYFEKSGPSRPGRDFSKLALSKKWVDAPLPLPHSPPSPAIIPAPRDGVRAKTSAARHTGSALTARWPRSREARSHAILISSHTSRFPPGVCVAPRAAARKQSGMGVPFFKACVTPRQQFCGECNA